MEIFERNVWKGICSDAWGLPEAQVACRQLGLPPPRATLPGGTFGAAPPGAALLQARPDCEGQEYSLVACPRSDGACGVGDAAVRCGRPAEGERCMWATRHGSRYHLSMDTGGALHTYTG